MNLKWPGQLSVTVAIQFPFDESLTLRDLSCWARGTMENFVID